jgi:DNA helicase II / ATP-dependent DNA helicase PcrA
LRVIDIDKFVAAARSPAVLDKKLNQEQEDSVRHGPGKALMIVAGPGSGKTTVLVLRALRHILVDGYAPENVLITTFTRKAAAELRDRLIDWGTRLIEHFVVLESQGSPTRKWLEDVDINGVQTGTLDSFLQAWLRAIKPVGEPARIMLEQFAAKLIYRRRIFRSIPAPVFMAPPSDFYQYLGQFCFEGAAPRTVAEAADSVGRCGYQRRNPA